VTPRAAIVAVFAVLLCLAVATELVARRPGSTLRPLSDTLAAALHTRGGRVVVLAVWLWLGWHLLAR